MCRAGVTHHDVLRRRSGLATARRFMLENHGVGVLLSRAAGGFRGLLGGEAVLDLGHQPANVAAEELGGPAGVVWQW
jgi:hypothetical protein